MDCVDCLPEQVLCVLCPMMPMDKRFWLLGLRERRASIEQPSSHGCRNSTACECCVYQSNLSAVSNIQIRLALLAESACYIFTLPVAATDCAMKPIEATVRIRVQKSAVITRFWHYKNGGVIRNVAEDSFLEPAINFFLCFCFSGMK